MERVTRSISSACETPQDAWSLVKGTCASFCSHLSLANGVCAYRDVGSLLVEVVYRFQICLVDEKAMEIARDVCPCAYVCACAYAYDLSIHAEVIYHVDVYRIHEKR